MQRFSKTSKLSLLNSLATALLITILESIIAAYYYTSLANTTAADRNIFVYLIMFTLSQVFQFIFYLNAIVHQNMIQIIAHFVFFSCCLAYSIFQYSQLKGILSAQYDYAFAAVRPFLSAIIIVFGSAWILFACALHPFYQEFGWQVYKRLGADPQIKSSISIYSTIDMYRNYQIFVMILKLDVFFSVIFVTLFLVILPIDDAEFPLSIVAGIIMSLFLLLALNGLKNEKKLYLRLFIGECVILLAYMIFKIVRVNSPDQADRYVGSIKFLTFFGKWVVNGRVASVSIFCTLLTLINAIVCLNNFGKGLKEKSKDELLF
ncbi:hypothetical protein O9G_000805 [Rozella allomycis CSF55]|uniref:Uncharacterized protein n=1 Tax=Rozella allomycis (strain CSF55) TaxID=988480 RepID=A0A075ARD2_ROZAC|nr:hypothetical protein O9G_000805 [Rozella allomycis CSF55]|eukprot:EPZ32730.1 hypothetical protein O9G_000805 [Rozella allomycis CSF55]